jgi:hypothetical protein
LPQSTIGEPIGLLPVPQILSTLGPALALLGEVEETDRTRSVFCGMGADDVFRNEKGLGIRAIAVTNGKMSIRMALATMRFRVRTATR